MKFYAPDKSLLIDVQAITPHAEGIQIEGKIMGAMPMKAVLRPSEMRSVFSLLSWKLVFRAITMLFRSDAAIKKSVPKGK